MTRSTRPRVCAAIFRNDTILMVRHVHHSLDYWTLPGGGVQRGESLPDAVIREVFEETGLHVHVGRYLYEEKYTLGINYCFEALEIGQQKIQLGCDPEDADKPPAERMLQDVAWRQLAEVKHDFQIAKVLEVLRNRRQDDRKNTRR